MTPPREDTQPWYRQFWPWFLIALPATAVVAGITTLNLAMDTNDGLVKDDYYKEGLAIYKDAARVESAHRLGIRAQVSVDEASGRVDVQLNDAAIGQVQHLALSVTHPTLAHRDQRVVLSRTTAGHYVGRLAALEDANWKLALSPPSGQWRVSGRLAVPKQASAALQ